MRAFSLVLIALALTPVAFAQSNARKPSRTAASERLKAIEQGLARAYVKGDRAFIEQVLADDWTVTDAGGQVLDKAQVLRETFENRDRRVEAARIDQVTVRLYADSAVVTGRSWFKGAYRGTSMSATFRFTDVFVRIRGEWKCVASQATMLPPQ